MNSTYKKDGYEEKADLFKTIANSKRLQILDLLRPGEMYVTELTKKMGIRKANTSQHMAVLKYTGLVESRREGKNVFYRLSNPKIIDFLQTADSL